jgi:hypothetical protein
MPYLKHNSKTKQPKSAKKPEDATRVVVTGPDTGHMPSPSLQHDINHVAGLADIEASLDWIAKGISRLTSDEQCIHLSVSTGYNTDPIKLTLAPNDYDDTLDRVVTAFERIADSLARLAGLSRPRLECWHEQEEYRPRYRDIACDGGAPGPDAKGGEGK